MKSDRHITLKCGTKLYLDDLEAAGLSYVPCGQNHEGQDTPLLPFADLWNSRRQVKLSNYGKKVNSWTLQQMTGVQLMTGKPSSRGDALLTDIDIEYRFIEKYPKRHQKFREMYIEACVGEPCIIVTKLFGERWTGYCEYLDRKRPYTDKDRTPEEVAAKKKPMLVEIFSDKGLSRLDHRYAIEQGNLLKLPTYPKKLLQDIHDLLIEEVADELAYKPASERSVVGESQIGDLVIEWSSDNRSQLFPSSHCRATSHGSNRDEVRFTRYADGSIDGHCFNCCESWWEIEPPRSSIRRPVKLQKNVVSMLTETLPQSREFLKSVFSDKKIKFFGLRADTGVGKSEEMIAFLVRGFSGLITVPTTDLAKELENRCHAKEVNGVFRYRGILSDPEGAFPDEKPCIHAVLYDAIARRGWNAYNLLCESCEVREMCEEQGYRSQARRAKEAQIIVMPFPDIFLNPAFRSLAKKFLPTDSDDLSMHDEFDPYTAFLDINVPKSRLQQMRDDWEGYDVSTFAKEILRILEVDGDMSELRKLVMGLTASERASVIKGLTCVMWNGQVLSREDAHRCHEFIAKTHNTERILTLPRLETGDWNLIVQLELFFERYRRDADMPMKYENDTLTFLLPPLPMKTRARMGFMSATLDETLFRRCFDTRAEKRGDVTFHDTGLTEWHPEARVFPLRTNRNPRATAYTPKGERVDGELLSQSGEFYWGLVSDDMKNDNRGLVTYKALIDEKGTELEGIPTANFGGLVGLDTHFKDIEVLHILFSPEVPPTAVEFKAKALFGNDSEPLCYERDENGQYKDARLQQCYDDGVISELLQAIGRGRLVSKAITIVIWCSHHLPGITDREQTLPFDEVDWHEAEGDISKLADVIEAREAAAQSGDVQAYAAATGQSQRTARRHTQEQRKQTKAERNAEIKRRYAGGAGETQQQIADALNIGLATVNRVLNS